MPVHMPELDWISKYFAPLATSSGAHALRDDVAQFRAAQGPVIVTMDTMIEGVHFLAGDPIGTVARKLVRVNVSDIVAKGAVPSEALLALSWTSGRSEQDVADFAAALGEELEAWGTELIGGDTTSHEGGLVLTLTLTGQCLGTGPVRRSGAGPGQEVWVTGTIGAAGLGLASLQGGASDDALAQAYRVPDLPPLDTARLIAEFATASLDVSDGLLLDASRLADASQTGLRLCLDLVPTPVPARNVDEILEFATFGDDYQILFTIEPASAEALRNACQEKRIKVTRIGETGPGRGLSLAYCDRPVNLPETLGFEHG